MSKHGFIAPDTLDALKPVAEQQESEFKIKAGPQIVETKKGQMAVWAVVSEFTLVETFKFFSTAIVALEKLGKKDEAQEIEAVVTKVRKTFFDE